MAPMRPRVSIIPRASVVMSASRWKRRKASILNTMRQYGYHALLMFIRIARTVAVAAALAGVTACGGTKSTPPVATVNVTVSKAKVALGGLIELTYRFQV